MKLEENQTIPSSEVFILENGEPVKKNIDSILKNKKSIISIINQGKEVYKVALNFDLSMMTNDSLMKTLKITSSLDFELLNKYSITQRDKVIIYNVNKLIKLVDEKITFQLNSKAFNKFIIL